MQTKEVKISLNERFKSKFPINEIWDCDLFKMVNPTLSPCSFNLFDGFQITPVANTPYGYVPPTPATQLLPPAMNFPSVSPTAYPNAICSLMPSTGLNKAIAYIPSTNVIYVNNYGSNVDIYDVATSSLLGTIFLFEFICNFMIVYNPNNNRAYLTGTGQSFIVVIDCSSNSYIGYYQSSGSTQYIALDTSTDKLYSIVDGTSLIDIFDTTSLSNAPINTINVGDSPSALVHFNNGINDYIGVVKSDVSLLTYIDTDTDTFVNHSASIAAPLSLSSYGGICYDSNKKTIYYTDSSGNILEFDTINFNMIPNSLNPFSNICSNLNFVPSLNKIYTYGYDTLKIIDTLSNAITDTITFSSGNGDLGNNIYIQNINKVYVALNTNYDTSTIPIICAANPSPQCYIVGSTDYNSFAFELKNDPICVRQIEVFSQNQSQLTQPLQIQTKDANGNMCSFPKLPNVNVSSSQFQSDISVVDFNPKELILDCNTTINQYTIPPQSEITFIIYYKQIKKSDILTRVTTLCGIKSGDCPDGNKRSESELLFNSNSRVYTRPVWSKKFNFKMIKEHFIGIETCNPDELARPIIK